VGSLDTRGRSLRRCRNSNLSRVAFNNDVRVEPSTGEFCSRRGRSVGKKISRPHGSGYPFGSSMIFIAKTVKWSSMPIETRSKTQEILFPRITRGFKVWLFEGYGWFVFLRA
jgi:hypothetical protein